MTIAELRQLKSDLRRDYILCHLRTLDPAHFLNTLETKVALAFRIARRNIETYRHYDDPNYKDLQTAHDEVELTYQQILSWTKRRVKRRHKTPAVVCNPSSVKLEPRSSNGLSADLACGLPNEIWIKIFRYFSMKDRYKVGCCNHQLRQVGDVPYVYSWVNLKELTWMAPVMEQLEKEWPTASCFYLLLQLKQHFFFQLGIFPPTKLPQTQSEYKRWHQHARNENDLALVKIFGNLLHNYQAPVIRAWLKDPNHSKLLTQVTKLDLADSRLKILPSEIALFTKLKSLNLNGNKLHTVPVEIGLLSELEYLDLQSNDLFYIPEELGSLTRLKKLFLNNNLLRNVPKKILSIPYLEINTSGNPWL